MEKGQPLVSIGMPVYNGESFLQEALDSLLAQTFENFELIISDNASTDKTESICREYAAKDQRIRYYRNPLNIGCAQNFNRVFKLSSSKYFKWAAYDDIHAPNFLEACIGILDRNPSVVLCHSRVKFIDELGQFIRDYNVQLKTDSPKPHIRYHELLVPHLCYQIYGVIRSDILKETKLYGNYGYAEAVLLVQLGLRGQFYELPEYLFFARKHKNQSSSLFNTSDFLYFAERRNPKESISMLPDFYAFKLWHEPTRKNQISFPHWRIFWGFLNSIFQAPLSPRESIACLLSLYKQLKGTEYLLIKDLTIAAKIVLSYFPPFLVSRRLKE